MHSSRSLASACVGVTTLALAGIVSAQDAPAGNEGVGLAEVVVTARKTAERLQEVPLAVTAISAAEMAERTVRSLSDIAALTPGLNFEDYLGGNGTPVIRGAAQARIQDLDQNVSSFYDGIYLPRQYLVNPGVMGLERVEVVKGPQSALYGRNAFMGAINYVTKKPDDRWRGALEATVGADERYDIIGDLSGPIIPGKLFARIGGGYSEFDGDIENGHPNAGARIPNGSTGNLNGWKNAAVQARVVFRPVDSLELDASVSRLSVFQETPALVRVQRSTGDTNCGSLINGRYTLYCGELPWRFGPLPGNTTDAAAVADPRGFGIDANSTIARGHLEWRPRESLGFVYEYGRLTARALGGGASDRDPILGSVNIFAPTAPRGNQFQLSPAGDLAYTSNELRVELAAGKRLSLMLGAFTSELKDFDFFPFNAGLPLLGTAPADIGQPGWFILSSGRTTVDAEAIFGRVNWRLSDALRLGFEARYAEEEKTLVSGPTSFSPAVRALNGTWNQFTPRISLDYKLTSSHMLYLTGAKGAKSGGFNLSALIPQQFTFEEDENWTYELGSKNTFLGGRLRLNAALFHIDWKNQQVSCSALGSQIGITPPAVICNLGEASIQGIEVDAAYAATDRLTLTLGASYNDATYDDGVVNQRVRDFGSCDDITCPRSGAIGGNELARQSKVQAVAGVQLEQPLTSKLGLFVNGDASYKSKQYADDLNLAYLPARTLANLRLGLRGEQWELAAWAKNLFDERYPASAFFILVGTETQYVPIVGRGRTYGLTARFSF